MGRTGLGPSSGSALGRPQQSEPPPFHRQSGRPEFTMTLLHGFASLPCFCSPSLSPSKTQFKRAELRPPRSELPAPPPGTRRCRRGLPGAVTAHAPRAGLPSGRASVTQAARKPELRLSRQRARRAFTVHPGVFAFLRVLSFRRSENHVSLFRVVSPSRFQSRWTVGTAFDCSPGP